MLARLIFGQGTADLSPLQIAQLAEAAAQLAGVGGSTGLLENLRAQLGVDDLDIKTNADGQTAVGVGKYINDNTYLGVDSTGRVSIDLDLGAGLKARGAVIGHRRRRGRRVLRERILRRRGPFEAGADPQAPNALGAAARRVTDARTVRPGPECRRRRKKGAVRRRRPFDQRTDLGRDQEPLP